MVRSGRIPILSGEDWSSFLSMTYFDGKGAILVASTPNGVLTDNFEGTLRFSSPLTVNGSDPFYASEANSYLGDNHFPAQDKVADFFFFDLGNIFGPLGWSEKTISKNKSVIEVETNTLVSVPDFQGSGTAELGQLLLPLVHITGDVDWVHFDVIALRTALDYSNGNLESRTVVVGTDTEDNPNSHDVTWYKDETVPPTAIPEPSVVLLLGAGLFGLGMARRMRPLR